MKKDNKSETEMLRQKAEELLKKKLSKAGSKLSETDMLKLIHEIQVHQEELEIQKEELMFARSAAQDAIDLYDFAPTGYFSLSQEGKIIKLNLSGAEMLGQECLLLINNKFDFFVFEDSRTIFNDFLRKVFENKTKEICDVALSAIGSLPRYVQLTGLVVENGKQCIVTAVDITQLKRREEELRYSEERYRSLFFMAWEGIFEELSKKKPSKINFPLSEVEMLKLIREFELHQLKLELQNEELKKALSVGQDAIDLYDFAPTGYFTLSKWVKLKS